MTQAEIEALVLFHVDKWDADWVGIEHNVRTLAAALHATWERELTEERRRVAKLVANDCADKMDAADARRDG